MKNGIKGGASVLTVIGRGKINCRGATSYYDLPDVPYGGLKMRELLRITPDTNPAHTHTQLKEIDGARVFCHP